MGREQRGGEAMFYVRDNGAGFDMVHSDQLFRASAACTTRRSTPAPASLVTVQRIVQRHGGRVDFDSEVDEGACFWFWVPDRSGSA